MRGGGGNFGIVTSFRFTLHPVGPTVVAGPVFWAAEDTTDVLRFYRDFVSDAPDELGNVIRLGTIPPLPAVGEELHFRPAIAVASCTPGRSKTGGMPSVRSANSGRRSWTSSDPARTSTTRAASTTPFPTAGTTTGRPRTSPACQTKSSTSSPSTPTEPHRRGRTRRFSTWVAQYARAPREATAYAGRDVEHNIIIDAVWLPDQHDTVRAAETAWAQQFLAALEPQHAGVYVNFLDSDDDMSRVREAYGNDTYRRLTEVKAKYDPENVFHNNKNIQPGTPAQ